MPRQTSIEAFNAIKENGLLSKRRWQVYEILFNHGPLTANQVVEIYQKEINRDQNTGVITTRLSELRNQNVVQELGVVNCPVTSRKVILWDVTKKLPVKFDRPKKLKCHHCNGRGFKIEQQGRLF